MLLYMASALVFLFTAISLFWRAHCPLALKLAGSAFLLLISLKYEIYRWFGQWFFAPQLPRPLLLCLEALYAALILLFFLLLLFHIYLAGNWLLARAGMPAPRHLPAGLIKSGLCLLALCLGVWATWQAVKVPDVRAIAIRIANLPAALENFRIVQLSDLHVGPILKKDWLAEVVGKTNALEPDLILLTGDYVDGFAADIGEELAPLGGLSARFGVLAVTGNHEYYWNMPEWRNELRQMGIDILENEHRLLKVNGATLVIAGIPDPVGEKFGFAAPDAAKALAGAPAAVRILLSHRPLWQQGGGERAQLVLSGHTHGGIMFFLGPLIARFNQGFVAGLYPDAGAFTYVNAGTGLWNGFSARLGVPAEITEITLAAKED